MEQIYKNEVKAIVVLMLLNTLKLQDLHEKLASLNSESKYVNKLGKIVDGLSVIDWTLFTEEI